MDQIRIGELIRQLRTQMGLTQNQLAERICVSNKTVSKWECANGCPDIGSLSALSEVFGTDIRVLLSGEINKNETDKGNMKKLRFYVCSTCGNIITSATDADITCCGRRLEALEAKKAEESEKLSVSDIGGELFISSDHPMTKEHHIAFVAYVSDASAMMFRQYPEWDVQITMPLYRSGRLVWYCTKDGMFYQDL